MNSLVSIIIPTKNSAEFLDKCLESIKNQTYKNAELIVVDNNSTDNTKEIVEKFNCHSELDLESNINAQLFNKGPERSAQRNFGVQQAKGDYLLIIDSDMKLSENVIVSCIEKIKSDDKIKGVIIPEKSFGIGFWAQCKRLERSFYINVDWMEAARFFRRETFEEMEGYDEENTGTEDYDLPQRIEAKYGKESIGRIDELIYHNENKVNLVKTCKKKFYYAQRLNKYKSVEANLNKFRKQSNILARYKLFLFQPKKLFKNPILGLGMLFMKTCEFGFGGIGYLINKVKK